MDIDYLRYFKKIAELENMSMASKSLNISQSSLSRILKNIEDEYGAPLFDRVGKHLHLNKSGQILLGYASQILTLVDQSYAEISNVSQESQSIVVTALNSNCLIPETLAAFTARYPQIHVSLRSFSSEDTVNTQGGLMIHTSDRIASSYPSSIILAEEECLLGMSPNHRLARKEAISLSMLQDERFVVLNKENPLGSTTAAFFEETGIPANIAIQCDTQTAIGEFVSSNVGIGIFPTLTWKVSNTDIVYKRISGYHIVRTLYLTTLSSNVQTAENTFIRFATTFLRDYVARNAAAQTSAE